MQIVSYKHIPLIESKLIKISNTDNIHVCEKLFTYEVKFIT